jgi:hypothetical protein
MPAEYPLAVFTLVGVILLVLGILAIIGGIYTLKRNHFGSSLVGSIAALLPINPLALAAIILLIIS